MAATKPKRCSNEAKMCSGL